MKKIAVLATSLVLGLSSVAFAKPAAPVYAPAPHQLHDRGFHRPLPAHWTMLSAASLGPRGRAFVDVSTNARFTKLKLATNSALFVDKVMIVYANGKTQLVDLDKRLSRYDSSLIIDLEGN